MASDDDTDCSDTVMSFKQLSDKTMWTLVGKTINFRAQASVSLETSKTTVRRGDEVKFTASVTGEFYPGIAVLRSSWLERKIGSGPWEKVISSGNDYFYFPDYTEYGVSPQEAGSDEMKIRIHETAQYRVKIDVCSITAATSYWSNSYSKPVTITVK